MFLIIGILLFAELGHSKLIIISDIDDTVKVSHIRSTIGSIKNAFKLNNYTQMQGLYQLLKANHPQAEFHYVTNAFSFLMKKSHTQFIRNWGYPSGPIYFRTLKNKNNHKIKAIRSILNTSMPSVVILLGDNAEKDILVYEKIVKEFSPQGIEFKQFIRISYYEPEVLGLLKNQVGFVTPLEVALELHQTHLLRSKSLTPFIKTVSEGLEKEALEGVVGSQSYFRPWTQCPQFQWRWYNYHTPPVIRAFELITEKCH